MSSRRRPTNPRGGSRSESARTVPALAASLRKRGFACALSRAARASSPGARARANADSHDREGSFMSALRAAAACVPPMLPSVQIATFQSSAPLAIGDARHQFGPGTRVGERERLTSSRAGQERHEPLARVRGSAHEQYRNTGQLLERIGRCCLAARKLHLHLITETSERLGSGEHELCRRPLRSRGDFRRRRSICARR